LRHRWRNSAVKTAMMNGIHPCTIFDARQCLDKDALEQAVATQVEEIKT
jgi:hypothetical protein